MVKKIFILSCTLLMTYELCAAESSIGQEIWAGNGQLIGYRATDGSIVSSYENSYYKINMNAADSKQEPFIFNNKKWHYDALSKRWYTFSSEQELASDNIISYLPVSAIFSGKYAVLRQNGCRTAAILDNGKVTWIKNTSAASNQNLNNASYANFPGYPQL